MHKEHAQRKSDLANMNQLEDLVGKHISLMCADKEYNGVMTGIISTHESDFIKIISTPKFFITAPLNADKNSLLINVKDIEAIFQRSFSYTEWNINKWWNSTKILKVEKKLVPVPKYPQNNIDFSLLIPDTQRYAEVEKILKKFDHLLLRRLAFVESYDGPPIPRGRRSLTFRATIGDAGRTLSKEDIQEFREYLFAFLDENDLHI